MDPFKKLITYVNQLDLISEFYLDQYKNDLSMTGYSQ